MTEDEEVFDFVVARPWGDPKDGLCIYAYGSQIQRGTLIGAKVFLEYVQQRSPEHKDAYAIYKLTLERIN